MKPAVKFALMLVVVAGLAPLAFRAEAQNGQPPVAPNKFQGKVAVFYLSGSQDEASVMIRDARLEKVQDRWFVTGESPDTGIDDWTRETDAGVDWARVESYYVFTEQQFKEQVFEGPQIDNLDI